ncbi:MAG: YheT family hydrolase, partial [Candidatus Rokuibacteriota bacterium]
GPPRTPLVLVLHGLEGSARSHYAIGLLRLIRQQGWRGVVMNFRSCSGELNRQPRFYHSGETEDLAFIVDLIERREPTVRMGAVGTSLGGNVLLKWLGERGDAVPPPLRGAVGVSVPFDLAVCARRLDRGLCRILYTSNFLRTMRRKVRDKARRFPGFVDVKTAWRARTFAEYDRVVTAPLNGFADEFDYWRRASSGPYLAGIRRPVLLISALDDPLVPPEVLPHPSLLPGQVTAEFVANGGHAAFLDGLWPWGATSWAERRALRFLKTVLVGHRGIC